MKPAMKDLIEKPFFYEIEDSRVFAVHHAPISPEKDRGLGLVFCAPFAEEAAIAQKICVDFARKLAKQGYHVLRFDYRGCGDSGGDFTDATVTTRVTDIRAMVTWLYQHTSCPVCLFGLRLGATFAILAAGEDPSIRSLLLWEPIIRPAQYMNNFLRTQVLARNIINGEVVESRERLRGRLEAGESVDILGFPLGAQCYRELLELDMLERVNLVQCPVSMFSIGRSGNIPSELRELHGLPRSTNDRITVERVKDQPFWIDPNDPWRELKFWHGHEQLFERSIQGLEGMTHSV